MRRLFFIIALLALGLSSSAPAATNGRLVFSRYTPDGGDLWSIAVDGSAPAQLTSGGKDRDPAVSPDGTLVAFIRVNRLCVIAFDATDLRCFALPAAPFPMQPTWSPDGTKIAFLHQGINQPLGSELWVVRADGTRPKQILAPGYGPWSPKWSPDGSRIAFAGLPVADGTSYVQDLFTVRPDGTDVRNLTQTADHSEDDPDWSPDGSRLAFHELGRPPVLGSIAADGSDRRALGPGWEPAFSPDGTLLAVSEPLSPPNFVTRILLQPAAGGPATPVTDATSSARRAVWQPIVDLATPIAHAVADKARPRRIQRGLDFAYGTLNAGRLRVKLISDGHPVARSDAQLTWLDPIAEIKPTRAQPGRRVKVVVDYTPPAGVTQHATVRRRL